MVDVKHVTMEELEAGLEEIRQSPKDQGDGATPRRPKRRRAFSL